MYMRDLYFFFELSLAKSTSCNIIDTVFLTTIRESIMRTLNRSVPSLRNRTGIPLIEVARRSGWTVIELLVVIAVLSMLVAIILPAVQSARATARKTQCGNHLRQQAQAVINYETANGKFPYFCWKQELLPYLDQAPLYEDIKRRAQQYFDDTGEYYFAFRTADVVEIFLCPSDPAPAQLIHIDDRDGSSYRTACTNYVWNDGSFGTERQGFFDMLEKPMSSASIVDGLSVTAMLSETLHSSGENHRLRSIWSSSRNFTPGEIEEFMSYCESLPVEPWNHGYRGAPSRGWAWPSPQPRDSGYTHVLPPNRPSCVAHGGVRRILTPSSFHAGGVNVVYGDTHLDFVSESIDREVWWQQGSSRSRRDF
jgi:prepilin-type N-terminal cleavage/methylation domain-containing protein